MLPVIRTILFLGCSMSAAMACDAPSGAWRSSEGTIHFPQQPSASIYARYTQDNGRLLVRRKGHVLEGVWVEKSSAKRCATAVDGSRHWGRVRFVFTDNFEQFTGQWSYCDAPLASTWTGNRIEPCKVAQPSPTPTPLPVTPAPLPPPTLAKLLDIAFISAKTGKRYGLHDALSPREPFRILATFDMKPELSQDKVLLEAKQTGNVRLSWYPAKSATNPSKRLVSGVVSRAYRDGEWLTASFKGKTAKIQVKALNVKMAGPRRVAWGSNADYKLNMEHNGAAVPWFPSVKWSVEPPVVGIKGFSRKAQLVLPKKRGTKQLITIIAKASGQSKLGKIRRVVRKQVLIGLDDAACQRLETERERWRSAHAETQRNLRAAIAERDSLPIPDVAEAQQLQVLSAEVATMQEKVAKLQKVVDELNRTRQHLNAQQRSLALTQVKLGRAMTEVARMYATKSWYPSSSGTSRYAQWLYMQGVLGRAAPRNLRAASWQADMAQASVKAAKAKFVILGKAFVDLGGLVTLAVPSSNLSRLASQANAIKNFELFLASTKLDNVMNTSVYLNSLRSDITALRGLGNDMAQLKALAKGVSNGTVERGALNRKLVSVYQQVLAARLRVHQRYESTGKLLSPVINARNQAQQQWRTKHALLDKRRAAHAAALKKNQANAAKRQQLEGQIRRLRSADNRVANKRAMAEQKWHERCDEPSAVRIETDKSRYAPGDTMRIRVYGGENIPADAVLQIYPANVSVAPSDKGYAVWPSRVVGISAPKKAGKYIVFLHSPSRGTVSQTTFSIATDLNGLWEYSSRGGAYATIRFEQTGNQLNLYIADAKTLTRWGFADGERIGTYTVSGNTLRGTAVLRYPTRYKTRCPAQYEFIAQSTGVITASNRVSISWGPDQRINGNCKVDVLQTSVTADYVRVP